MKLRTHSLVNAAVQGGLMLTVGLVMGLLVFTPYSTDGKITPLGATGYIIIAAFFTGVIAAIGGINTARKDYLEGKIQLGDTDKERTRKAPAPRRPMWLMPLLYESFQLTAFAAAAVVLNFFVFSEGLSRWAFVLMSALTMGIHSGLAAFVVSGRELFKYISHPQKEAPAFKKNMLIEHVLGNTVANFGINSGLGYVFYHYLVAHPENPVKFLNLLADLFIMCGCVAVLVPIGTAMQAANETREGRVAAPARKSSRRPGGLIRILIYLGIAEGPVLVFAALSRLSGIESFGLQEVMFIKGAVSAVAAAFVGGFAAYFTASRTASEMSEAAENKNAS